MSVGELPITLATAKAHLRVLHDDDDAAIAAMIAAGVEELEQRTGRALSALSAELRLNAFPDGPISIPRPPLVAVQSITYTTTGGDVVTIAENEYAVDASHSPALVSPVTSWPTALDRPGSIVIAFTAGDPANCSPRLKNALLLWLDKNYHEHAWLESRRIGERIDAVVSAMTLHTRGLSGVTV